MTDHVDFIGLSSRTVRPVQDVDLEAALIRVEQACGMDTANLIRNTIESLRGRLDMVEIEEDPLSLLTGCHVCHSASLTHYSIQLLDNGASVFRYFCMHHVPDGAILIEDEND
jgi:hypothetical protein